MSWRFIIDQQNAQNLNFEVLYNFEYSIYPTDNYYYIIFKIIDINLLNV